MVHWIRLKRFKNFEDAKLHVGPFTVIVGANASGKSNVRDALRVLHGIGRSYRLSEIIGGKFGPGGTVEWEPVRGALNEVIAFGSVSCELEAHVSLPDKRRATYWIVIGRDKHAHGDFGVQHEELEVGGSMMFSSNPPGYDPIMQQQSDTQLLIRMARTGKQKRLGHRVSLRRDQPALTQLPLIPHVVKAHKDACRQVAGVFERFRFLDPVPDLMREPAFPGRVKLGDNGQHLPVVLREICADSSRRDNLLEWVRSLTPMDATDFDFPAAPDTGRVRLVIIDGQDKRLSAYSASDGTLRFLGILAALFESETQDQLLVFEEIDNGIHPARMHLMVDLIEGQTESRRVQVVTSTHSPELLALLSDISFQHSSVASRMEDSDHAALSRIRDLPNATELRRTRGLLQLHASGWMEDVIAFGASRAAVDQ